MKVWPTTAYCMNLDSRTDRWKQVTTDFERLTVEMPDLVLERVSAVAIPERPQEGVTKTVHKIINIAKENKLPYVLILEDDLFVVDAKKVVNCLENAPEDWDILSGGAYHYVPDKSWSLDWMQMKDFCSMHFIIIRDTAYEKVLARRSFALHIDRVLGNEVKKGVLKMYLMHPMPCQQRPGFSDLRKCKVDDNKRKLPWVKHPDVMHG